MKKLSIPWWFNHTERFFGNVYRGLAITMQHHCVFPQHLVPTTEPSISSLSVDCAILSCFLVLMIVALLSLMLLHYCRKVLRRHMYRRPFDQTVCDAWIANGVVKEPSPIKQTVCDGGSIKYDSEKSWMCDMWHTLDHHELFVISQNSRNGYIDPDVCNRRHIVYSDKLFALIQQSMNDLA